MKSKGHVNLLVRAPHSQSPICGSGDETFLITYVISQDHVTRATWLYGNESLMANHDLAKFGGQRHDGYGDIMVLVCHVILKKHLTKGWWNFLGSSPSRQITILLSLVAIVTRVVGICLQFVTWSRKITWSKGHVTLSVEAPHSKSPPCQAWWP